MLVVARRHVADYFALEASEQAALWGLTPAVKRLIEAEHSPSGYNLGINIGPHAGQTIDHVHLHVIPRYEGDVPDPRGGVRWVLPRHAAYWAREQARP
jgi:diadenosine tetraphosphate (Ap4A) HIT family hydrolase